MTVYSVVVSGIPLVFSCVWASKDAPTEVIDRPWCELEQNRNVIQEYTAIYSSHEKVKDLYEMKEIKVITVDDVKGV